MNQLDKPKIAIIGCGYWGMNLVRNFYHLGVLDIVCDENQSSLDKVKHLYPKIQTTNNYKDVLKSDHIQAVAIATPAATHFKIAIEFLRKRKDVFVEKPVSLKLTDGIKLVKQANTGKNILMVGHVLEYHPAILQTQKMVLDGTIGDLNYIYSNRLNFGKVRKEENILWSFAPHDIAIILRIVGDTPISISASSADYLTPSVPDVTITNLSFKNGVKGHIHVSWLHPFKEHRLVVIGSKKMITFDDVSKKLLLYDQHVEIKDNEIKPISGNVTNIDYSNKEPLKLECESFVKSIQTRKRPLTDGESGLRVLEVLENAQESINNNGVSIITKQV
tara:strand:- start:1074 stop:2072 length:999 start_codon:yes stop_codon:yes gene_type:complete